MKLFEVPMFVAALFGFCFLSCLDAPPAQADFAFGTPVNLGPNINTSFGEIEPSLSADGLTLYYASDRTDGYGSVDLWMTRRMTKDGDWGLALNLGPLVNSTACENSPSVSSDGLELFFCDGVWGMGFPNRPGGYGDADLWVTKRPSQESGWGQPVNLGPVVNSPFYDGEPFISSDGLSLYFTSNRPGGFGGADMYVATRATKEDEWGAPVNLGPIVNSAGSEGSPCISTDGRVLFLARALVGGNNFDLWMTTRRTQTDAWGPPVNIGPIVNTSGNNAHDWGAEISPDGSTLYFCANRAGGVGYYDLWQVPIMPIVDFNGDGKVDIQDLLRLIESWGKDNPSVDIGPMPWGDGTIDQKDLEVLMGHWGQEVTDPTLIACWKLDEASGMIAADSAGIKNGTLAGNPIWQPDGGKVGGALQLDGVDDHVSTPFVLDPSSGSFSVIAWIKGGGAGQVVISQQTGADWLMADPSGGKLMTILQTPFRRGQTTTPPLISEVVITDGQWHRVCLVWDGSHRILYADGTEVARDTQTGLAASTGGLYIGCGANLESGSFWSGLIDDVRIYNRVVHP